MIQQAVETAFAALLREREIGGGTVIRCWHMLRDDYRWREDQDMTLPCIDLRAGMISISDDGASMELQATCLSQAIDDQDHQAIAMMAEATQSLMCELLTGSRTGGQGKTWQDFLGRVGETDSARIGGVVSLAGATPTSDGETNQTRITATFGVCAH